MTATTTERPATYGQLFGVTEFRAIFASSTLSAAGDMLARVAVAILIFDRTGSALLTASSFAISYAPALLGGPLLATLADRFPWRSTLIASDLARAALVALIAIPGTPLALTLVALFAVALLSAPFEAARVALLPKILHGELYVLGLAANTLAYQLAQVVGFVAGGAIVAFVSPHGALLVDAATFAISGLLLAAFLRPRPAPLGGAHDSWGRELLAGIRLIAAHPALRYIAFLTWATSAFSFAHEGLAAPLASELGAGDAAIGLLLAAGPAGVIVSGVLLTRVARPALRERLVPWLALLACGALLPVAIAPGVVVVAVLYFLSGLGGAFILPINATFNQLVPDGYRGRAAAVVIAGLAAGQGIAITLAGLVAEHLASATVVTLSGAAGLTIVVLLVARRPALAQSPA